MGMIEEFRVTGEVGLSSRVPPPGSIPPNARERELQTKVGRGCRVLLLGSHRELSLYRAAFLKTHGFDVDLPQGRNEVFRRIQEGGFDMVLLSYTLSSESVLDYTDMVREFCPACPLIVISKSGTEDKRVSPDAVVKADDGPEALLLAMRDCGRRTAN